MTADTSPETAAAEAALADAERRLAEVTAELHAMREALQQEHTLRGTWDHERGELRGDLAEARRRLDAEAQAHAQTRGAHDMLDSKVGGLQTELADARRETGRQRERGDRALRELEQAKRELQAEQGNHQTTREKLSTIETGRVREAQELAAAKAAAERQICERAELLDKLTADQTLLIEVQAKVDALTAELALASERAAAAKRALSEETASHASTRQRLEEAREAIREGERRRQRRTLVGVVGGAAVGVALMLRRRLGA